MEPDSCSPVGNVQAKADLYSIHSISATRLRRTFLSQAEPRFDLELFKLSITFSSTLTGHLSQQKGDPLWVALVWLASAAKDLAQRAPTEG